MIDNKPNTASKVSAKKKKKQYTSFWNPEIHAVRAKWRGRKESLHPIITYSTLFFHHRTNVQSTKVGRVTNHLSTTLPFQESISYSSLSAGMRSGPVRAQGVKGILFFKKYQIKIDLTPYQTSCIYIPRIRLSSRGTPTPIRWSEPRQAKKASIVYILISHTKALNVTYHTDETNIKNPTTGLGDLFLSTYTHRIGT